MKRLHSIHVSGLRPACVVTVAFAFGLSIAAAVSCAQDRTSPATLDPAHDDCASCRMRVSDQRFAGQIVAPGDEPRFYDDLGCLANDIKERSRPAGAVAYVADHRTREWVRAANAVYVRVPALQTPMYSHLIAHASVQSRDGDPEARGGEPITAGQVFGTARIPDGPAK